MERARVSNSAGGVDLVAGRDATRIGDGPPGEVTSLAEGEVDRLFGDALAALPPPPRRFTLHFRFESDELTEESRALVPEILKAVTEQNRPRRGRRRTYGYDRIDPGELRAGPQAGHHHSKSARERGAQRRRPRGHVAWRTGSVDSHSRRHAGTAQSPRRDCGQVIDGLASHDPHSTVRRITFLCGLVPTIVIAVLALYRPSFIARFDNGVYDLLLRWCPTRPPSGQVVIVDVDERSLSTVGQWPWRRDLVGRLIANLRDLGAATVALDIIFAERDRYDDSRLLEARPTSESPATFDSTLTETLRQGRVILGYAMTFDPAASAPGGCVLHPVGLAVQSREESDAAFFHATGAVCNLPELSRAARSSGFLNAAPDPDGILGRVPLVIQLDGRAYPGLGLAAVSAVTGTRYTALQVSNVNAAHLILDDRIVPVDGKSNLLVRYRGRKRTFPICRQPTCSAVNCRLAV